MAEKPAEIEVQLLSRSSVKSSFLLRLIFIYFSNYLSYSLRLFFERSFWKYPHTALAVIILKSLEYLSAILAALRE